MVAKPITDIQRVLLDDIKIKWIWYESELVHFREMWNEGETVKEMAKAFRTNARSIALVVMDQAELGEINQRQHGLY